MLRGAACRKSLKNATQFARQQSTAPPKRSFSLTRFLLKASALTGSVYGAGVGLSLYSDTFQDIWLDYVPGGEWSFETAERLWVQKGETSEFLGESLSDLKDRLSGLEKTVSVPKEGVISEKIDHFEKESAKVAEKVKQAASETVNSARSHIPLVDIKCGDLFVDRTVDSLNELIAAVNESSPDLASKAVSEIHQNLTTLSENYLKLTAEKTEQLDKLVAKTRDDLSSRFQAQQVEMSDNFLKEISLAKQEIESKFALKLESEVQSTKSKIALEAENIILHNKLSAIDQFYSVLSEKIDSERNSKLKDLEALASRVTEMEKLELEMAKKVNYINSLGDVKSTVSKLTQLVNSDSANKPVELTSAISRLVGLCLPLENEVINAALDTLPSESHLLSTGGVLTQSQIIARWELLVPELRSVALLPPNAGILGHFAAKLFGSLLMPKSGSPLEDGNDLESVIARVNGYLIRNELDNAVEEVSSLKGWSRRLANDWVDESRKKLELEFLVNIINAELTRL